MKVADIGEEDLRKRAQEEVKNHYAPTVEMVMETKGGEITPQIENMLILPALLPAYVLNCGEVKDKSWYKEPILITIGVFLLCVAACYFFLQPADFGFGIRMSAILTLIAGLMAGGVYSEKRKERFFRPIFQSSQTIREQQDPQPIFLEPEDGTIGSKLKANQADSGFKGFFKEILTSGSKPFFVGIGIFILVLALVIAIGG